LADEPDTEPNYVSFAWLEQCLGSSWRTKFCAAKLYLRNNKFLELLPTL
jgi:hypothetical protein